MGGTILAVGLGTAIWCAFRVRHDDAEKWHAWLYALGRRFPEDLRLVPVTPGASRA